MERIPLDDLTAFATVARLRSFRRAAAELVNGIEDVATATFRFRSAVLRVGDRFVAGNVVMERG